MQLVLFLSRRVRLLLRSRVFCTTLLALFFSLFFLFLSLRTNLVHLYDEGFRDTFFTLQDSIEGILRERGVSTLASDRVTCSDSTKAVPMTITIDRSKEVSWTVDQVTYTGRTLASTVSDFLLEKGIRYDSDDLLSHNENAFLSESECIVLKRVETFLEEEEEEIPFTTITKGSSLIRNGRSRVIQSGSVGKKLLTYSVTTIDGETLEASLVGEDILQYPTTQLSIYGDGSPISDIAGVPLDENGKPTSYQYVLEDQSATGYNAGRRGRGASGMRLYYGYCAVDPSKIPYGTLLYVTSKDNSFVYGFCIAADTGYAMLDGRSDIDLYYETYRESALNGRRTVDIYVIG